MDSVNTPRRGADILVSCLLNQGVDRVFCVPGESYLPVLDALYDARGAVDLVVCRQEGGAANMADAYGKLTGRPGICFVTRGPGATNASIGIHTAFQDSTPLVLFVGQVAREIKDREGFQEVDYTAMFAPLAKWVAEVNDPNRLPEYIHRAFQTALAGRPGPVVLSLPEDILSEIVRPDLDIGIAAARVEMAPTSAQIERLSQLLGASRKPLMIVGGGGWSTETSRDVLAFAERQGIPVATSLRCQDYVSNSHPNHCGHLGIGADPALVAHVKEADLLLVLGARLGEMTTAGYEMLRPPRLTQTLVHIHADPEELGRVYQADLPIAATAGAAAAALALLHGEVAEARSSWVATCHADYGKTLARPASSARLNMADAVARLKARMPAGTIVTNGAGNYAGWVHRYWPFERFRSQLAPTSGAMGYGVPAAVAAKLTFPDREVVAFAGDGCFLMNGQELATAAQYDAKILFVVVNNGMYGTIRMHQEREFPRRVYGTALKNPDFAALARAYGLHGERVEDMADFDAALERSLAAPGSALLELVTDPNVISVRTTITALRERGRT